MDRVMRSVALESDGPPVAGDTAVPLETNGPIDEAAAAARLSECVDVMAQIKSGTMPTYAAEVLRARFEAKWKAEDERAG